MKKKSNKPQPESTASESTQSESTEPKLEAAPEIETAVEAEFEAEVEAAAEEELAAEEAADEAETEAEAEDGPESEAEDSSEQAAEKLGISGENGEEHPSGAKARIDSAGFMRGLKPPPPSELSFSAASEAESEPEFTPQPRPPAKLERLQKILAQAGVASRRRAEELIEQGRVQVNGKVVTELGTKADGGRDHIRVDGKLLQGAERLRYFVLNKPKGFVTTVKDPEGRPTVMQFFDKMKERLYPVGRLDYMSEGLLLVTNDGELANRLTKASSGVEKTYLVKVAGQPTEAELDILRGGVSIERGKPGSAQVRTSPARIRQVRQGDNPWYEVVLIEGRNRELRKMFEEIGHFVEKIRRVGYGPLVLDQEPGNLRELEPEELELIQKAAEGKLRTPKAKELRRRNALDAQLPTLAPRPSRPRPAKPLEARPFEEDWAAAGRPGEFRSKRAFGPGQDKARPSRPTRPPGEGFRPAAGRTPDRGPAGAGDRPRRTSGAGPAKFGPARPTGRPPERPSARPDTRPAARPAARPAWKKDDRPTRPPSRFAAGSTGESRPVADRPRTGSAGTGRTGAGRPFTAKPTWKKPERQEWPAYKRPPAPRREAPVRDEDLGPVRPPNLHIEEVQAERSSTTRPSAPRSSSSRPSSSRPSPSRPSAPRPTSDRHRPSRSSSEGSTSSARLSAAKPFRGEGGLARPFTTSSGKPRAGGARPSSKPGKPAKPGTARSYGSASSARSGSGPRAGSDSRPSYGAKRPYGTKSTGHSSAGPAKRPFRRDEGEGSFAPRPPRPAAGSGARPARPHTPRAEGASDFRPTKAKPYPNSASRAERKAGPGWKPKPSFGGPGKPASGSRTKSKPGGFAKSGYKSKPGPKRPGGKKRS